VAVVLLTAASAQPVWGCSCAKSTAAAKLEHADVVLVGKVIRLEVVGSNEFGADLIDATLKVLDVVKGDLQENVVVRTSNGCCYCDIQFRKSGEYLVYAKFGASNTGLTDKSHLGTSICSSGTVDDRQEELKELGLSQHLWKDYGERPQDH